MVWFRLTEHATRDGVERLRSELLRPLPGEYDRPSQDVVNNELAMFRKSMGRKH